jgi:hypothetical protein
MLPTGINFINIFMHGFFMQMTKKLLKKAISQNIFVQNVCWLFGKSLKLFLAYSKLLLVHGNLPFTPKSLT